MPAMNTLDAFDLAFDAGADLVELDVRRTRDGVLVVHHDPITTNGQVIAETSFADLAPLADGRRIPRLVEALELVRRRGREAMVELKEQGYELDVLEVVSSILAIDRVRFLSFEPAAMARIEAANPAVRTGIVVPWIPDWLRDGITQLEHALRRRAAAAPLSNARAGADFVVFHTLLATPRAIRRAHERGLQVFVATPDSTSHLRRWLFDPSIDGVLTNRADRAHLLRNAT